MLNKIKLGKPKTETPQPEEIQSQPEPQAVAELPQDLNTSSPETNNSEADHFDHLIKETEAEEVQSTIDTTLISQEDFRKSFIGFHSMGAAMSGIQSLALPNSHINEATAEEIADTIYETILDIPLLRPMLQPGNKWIGRGFVMVVYISGMKNAVREEMAQRYKDQKPVDYSEVKQASKPKKKNDDDLDPEQVAALVGA